MFSGVCWTGSAPKPMGGQNIRKSAFKHPGPLGSHQCEDTSSKYILTQLLILMEKTLGGKTNGAAEKLLPSEEGGMEITWPLYIHELHVIRDTIFRHNCKSTYIGLSYIPW